MTLDLYINVANDYARDIRVPVLHPHVAIIHYDEAGEIRHSLNRIDCYGIFLQREFPENLTYGIGTYHEGNGSLIAFAPGQIGGKRDNGTTRQYHGWVLLFDPVFIHGTEIERRMKDYHFFSYNSNEALFLNTEVRTFLKACESNISVTLSLNNPTGISLVRSDNTTSRAYTLQGTLAQAGHKGIVIQNGEKIIR